MAVKRGATLDNGQHRRTEFIREVRHIMVDLDIENPGELHHEISEVLKGNEPSRATIYGYFNGTIRPQSWFLRALEKVADSKGRPLDEDQKAKLYSTYIASY